MIIIRLHKGVAGEYIFAGDIFFLYIGYFVLIAFIWKVVYNKMYNVLWKKGNKEGLQYEKIYVEETEAG